MKTPAQAKNDLLFRGETITGWARKNGFNTESVKKVLSGRSKCLYGEAHKIAVKLGIKQGVIVQEQGE